MHVDEARELRAAIGEALDPLYAARAGAIPATDGVLRAIPVLHRIDKALLAVLDRAARKTRPWRRRMSPSARGRLRRISRGESEKMALMAITARPATPARQPGEWRCSRCSRYLGRVIDRILHEPNRDRSVLPCIRHCPKCGKQNVRVQ